MIKEMDKERILGSMKRDQSITDFFTGAGTGIIASCLFSPSSAIRTVVIIIGFAMISIGNYRRAVYDRKVTQYLKDH